jgi:hypothetical protein
MRRKNEHGNMKMSAVNSIVHLANDAIFFLNRHGVIEVVNAAVPAIL